MIDAKRGIFKPAEALLYVPDDFCVICLRSVYDDNGAFFLQGMVLVRGPQLDVERASKNQVPGVLKITL